MNHYQILGVEPTASPEDIRRAWKQRARELHPDRGGDIGAFARLSEAHADLSDPVRRAQYDAMSVNPKSAVPPAAQPPTSATGERSSRPPLASVPSQPPAPSVRPAANVVDAATQAPSRSWMPEGRGGRLALGVGAVAAAAGLGGAAYHALDDDPWYDRIVKEAALPLGHAVPSFATRAQKIVGGIADAPRYLRDRASEGLAGRGFGVLRRPNAAPPASPAAAPAPPRASSPSSAVPPPIQPGVAAKSTWNQPQPRPIESYAPTSPQGADAASAGPSPQLRRMSPAPAQGDAGGVSASAGENLSVGSLSSQGVNPRNPDVSAPGGADAKVMGPSRWSRANTWARSNPYQAGAIGAGAVGTAAGAGYVGYDQMRDRPWYEGFVR